MKNFIFFSLFFFIFIFNHNFSQDYFVSTSNDIYLNNPTAYNSGNAQFDMEIINTGSDRLDIAISRIENTNSTGQFNFNNGNGVFGGVNLFNSPGVGNFIGNIFLILRSSVRKDLVVCGVNGWEIHYNENGVISGMVHNYIYPNLNGHYVQAGKFDNSDNNEDILFSNGTRQLYFSKNEMYGNLGNLIAINTLMPENYNVNKFRIVQMNDKGSGYIQYNPSDKCDIVFVAETVDPNKIIVCQNNNSNGFITNPLLAEIQMNGDFKIIYDFNVADFDNDGYNDIVVTRKKDECPSAVWATVYRNDNGASFYQLWSREIYPRNDNECPKIKVTTADINKDGLCDLMFTYLLYNHLGIYVDVYLADKNNYFAQNPIPYIIDAGAYELSEIVKIDAADIYGGQSYNGGGIALIISCAFSGSGDEPPHHYIKIVNAPVERQNSPPAAPIVQGLLEWDQGDGVWRPHLHLDNRGERDFDKYEITKLKDGELPYSFNLQDTGWTDYGECVVLGGEDSPYWNVHYYAKSIDKSGLYSVPSRYANYRTGCVPHPCEGCPGGDNSGQQNRPNENSANFSNKFSLSNFPNPFNPVTAIKFTVPYDSRVKIMVFNCVGELVTLLTDEFYSAGTYTVNYSGKNCASGIYYYVMEAGVYRKTNKMLLLK